jgi:hypothetical protein
MKEFKKPDVKGPRYRPEAQSILTKKFFEDFKNKYPKYKHLENADLRRIIKSFNEAFFQNVIDTRDGMQLPESIGWLFIGTCQTSKKKNIDFAKSNKYGVTVTNKNWETDGKLAKIFFTNYAPKHKMKNREFWSFVACRKFKRTVAKVYPENWNMYLVVEPNRKLKLAQQKIFLKDRAIANEKKKLESYNEFDL